MRTEAYHGDWAMIQDALTGTYQVLRAAREDELVNRWKQAGLKPMALVFLNPQAKKPPADFKPRKDRHLAWTGTLPKAWATWCKQHGVTVHAMTPYSEEVVRKLLMDGQAGVTFTPEAAEWFARVTAGDYAALATGLDMLPFLPQPIDVQSLSVTWDTPALYLAHRISHSLGSAEGLKLVVEVPRGLAYKVLSYYFTKSVERPEWVHALQLVLWAIDNRRLDPWGGLQIFALYTYQEAQWRSSSKQRAGGESSGSPRRSTPLQALYQACSTPFFPSGGWGIPSYKPGLRLLTSPGSQGN